MPLRLLALVLLLALPQAALAHPVLREHHDRTVVVHLRTALDKVQVQIHFRLEVDELTVLRDDMRPFEDEVDFFDYRNRPLDYYREFAKRYADVYAAHLQVRANDKPLDLRSTHFAPQLRDEEGKDLGHLRCDFTFESSFPLAAGTNVLRLYEGNYLLQPGQIRLGLKTEGLRVQSHTLADEAFVKRAAEKPEPGDDQRLRSLAVHFDLPTSVAAAPALDAGPGSKPPPALADQGMRGEPSQGPDPQAQSLPSPLGGEGQGVRGKPRAESRTHAAPVSLPSDPRGEGTGNVAANAPDASDGVTAVGPALTPATSVPRHDETYSLTRLFLRTDYSLWVLLVMSFVYGAAHALTPGHGKTLVAAYLVGQRGTSWHALVLGVVTTLTHTGSVLAIAFVLFLLPEGMHASFRTWIEQGLGLLMGVMVACMGFWLLLQRLAGRADHVHLDGSHHHGHGYHHTHLPADGQVSWWGLILLGITGGLVPCGDAILLLLYTLGRGEFWQVLPSVLSFSAGLAGVLVLIGVLVVQVPRFARSRWGEGRWMHALPLLSAVAVTTLGLYLCYEAVHASLGPTGPMP